MHLTVQYHALMHRAIDGPARRLAAVLRELRSDRRYTLDAAANRIGISRRLLIDLEAGSGNPSLTTLLRLAEGYGVGLADLVGYADKPALTVRGARDARTLWSTDRGSRAQLLIASNQLELWHWSMAPGEERLSEPHRSGTEEIVRMLTGRLRISVGDEESELAGTQTALIAGDRPHSYFNPGPRRATFHLVVHEPL
jgi:transcriptional regulator with XRE-family HTH domain